jgi:hypothetical protein
MGYRSQVYIGIPTNKRKDFEQLNLGETYENTPLQLTKILGVESEQEKIIIYKGDWLKWYPEYEAVRTITSFVEGLVDEDGYTDTPAFIVAVGEDGTIHSEWGSYYDWVEIYTQINII